MPWGQAGRSVGDGQADASGVSGPGAINNLDGVVVRPIKAMATALGPVTTVSVMAVKLVEERETGQNNAKGQVFLAKADQPAFVAWTGRSLL